MSNINRIDLNLFPVFEAIYREGSITAAARSLHLTQPAVSHALARLRAALDDELFQRASRGVKPTPVANQLIGPVRLALAQLQQGMNNSRQFDPQKLQQNFRISLRDLMEAMLMPPLVSLCQQQAPGIQFNCLSLSRAQLVHELSSGRIDLAADAWVAHDDTILHQKVLEDDLVCVMRPGHPATRNWGLEALLAWPHVQVSSREQGQGLEDMVLSREGLRRQVNVRCSHFFSAARMVRQSNLLLCLPKRFADNMLRELSLEIRPFPRFNTRLEFFLYWHRDQDSSPALTWIRQAVERLIHEANDYSPD